MLARLGQVFYWAACAFATLLLGFGVYAYSNGTGGDRWTPLIFFWLVGFAVWVLGRAVLYILTAK
jgi:hypothetical protein